MLLKWKFVTSLNVGLIIIISKENPTWSYSLRELHITVGLGTSYRVRVSEASRYSIDCNWTSKQHGKQLSIITS